MSKPETLCENVIMQAVVNAYNSQLHNSHHTVPDFNSMDETVMTPVVCYESSKILFIGYINNIYYALCLGGHRFESCRGLGFFLCPTLVTC